MKPRGSKAEPNPGRWAGNPRRLKLKLLAVDLNAPLGREVEAGFGPRALTSLQLDFSLVSGILTETSWT